MIYPNGAKVPVKSLRILEMISGDSNIDREYINSQFVAFFPEKYIKKQIKKGRVREEVLSKFRESNRYETMKG